MPTYNICKKCGTPTATSDIGTNGICRSCMQGAIQESENAKEQLSEGTEKPEWVGKGIKMFKVENGQRRDTEFAGKAAIAKKFGVSIQKVSAAMRWNKDIDGWEFK